LTQSVTKSPVLNIEHNNIDDSEESEEIPLSDSHSKNMLHQGWSILVHGTRSQDNIAEGAVNGGCALYDKILRRCIGWFICAFAVKAILRNS
jgi:hypothetical protein